MKISENWLREWVATDASLDEIAEQLTMAGLEVDAIEAAAPPLDGVVIGRIVECRPHPEADRLQICDVSVGQDAPFTIVCGAPNARTGAIVPVATVGTRLPGEMLIEPTTIRGVASTGMLCSARELGLSADAAGLWLLGADAPVGVPLADYLGLPDHVLDIDLTPNRGDCLSMRGVAREVAVAQDRSLVEPEIRAPRPDVETARTVYIDAPERCAGYGARCITAIQAGTPTPVWMQERLRRAGVKSINLPVDIGNYVMLELGQPMHAFDGDKLVGDIRVRLANAGERIATLDGDDIGLSKDTLVIADDDGPVAIAGMIGGKRTAVNGDTTSVVFESACFAPAAVAGQDRRYKIHTDSLHRFERGVDPALHPLALDRASGLLQRFGSGKTGPAVCVSGTPLSPIVRTINLDRDHVERLLGQPIDAQQIVRSLKALGIGLEPQGDGRWIAAPPSWRFDLNIEADLIEEIARIYGYDQLQTHAGAVSLPAVAPPGTDQNRVESILRQRGYNEAITYSFVEPGLHAALTGDADTIALDNPIADQFSQMRRTLWASLLPCWQHNLRRQQATVRLFERGLRFIRDRSSEQGIAQVPTLAGLISGNAEDVHWDRSPRAVDFFDIKGDVETLFTGVSGRLSFVADRHPALHPGRAARIRLDGGGVGWLGQLSPIFMATYKNSEMPYLFEVDSDALSLSGPIRLESVSGQPSVRRDLAVVVPERTPAMALTSAIESLQLSILETIEIFDIFRGEGLETGFKSVALGLIFQDKASTLTDERIDKTIIGVMTALRDQCNARIRGE